LRCRRSCDRPGGTLNSRGGFEAKFTRVFLCKFNVFTETDGPAWHRCWPGGWCGCLRQR
jgi:hypothetical protein